MHSSILSEIRDFFTRGSVLARLIGINLAVFVLVSFIRVLFFLVDAPSAYDGIINWLGVPSNTGNLLTKPWTAVSYMFLHFDFFHIFFNMIVLYVGGRLFRDFLGEERLTGTYIIGGLMGALFFILSYNIFPVFNEFVSMSVAIGASASVLAIFVAVATYMPNYKLPIIIIGPIRLKYIALFFVIFDLISIDKANSGGHLAHLGGALWGFTYIALLKNGKDPGKWLSTWIRALGSLFSRKPRMRVEYSNQRPVSDDEYNKQRVERQKQLDEILDKISRHGYESLSKEEKEILFKMSNKN
jgi:membrane associated rhomboid family serine protease